MYIILTTLYVQVTDPD